VGRVSTGYLTPSREDVSGFRSPTANPCNPPREIMLQFLNDETGTWSHRAYWGEDLIPWGTAGTVSRVYMGPLPPAGEWVRLEVPSAAVGLAAKTITGMSFALYDGQAWWDRIGKTSCTPIGCKYEYDGTKPASESAKLASSRGPRFGRIADEIPAGSPRLEPQPTGLDRIRFTAATRSAQSETLPQNDAPWLSRPPKIRRSRVHLPLP